MTQIYTYDRHTGMLRETQSADEWSEFLVEPIYRAMIIAMRECVMEQCSRKPEHVDSLLTAYQNILKLVWHAGDGDD